MTEENKENNPSTPEKMQVELGGGVVAELPIDDAKKYIQWKDSRTSAYNELQKSFETTSKTAKELQEKTKLFETMKDSQYESVKAEIESRLKSEYESVINELKSKYVHTAVDAAISSEESIVADATARNDLKQLFVSSVKDIPEDVSAIRTQLGEFVKNKPHFLRAKKEETSLPVKRDKVTSPTPQPSTSDALRKLLNL